MTAAPDILQDASAAWAGAVGSACWHGGVALAAAWVACRALPWAPARLKCWLWRVAYARLLVAVVWAARIELPVLAPPTDSGTATSAATVTTVVDPIGPDGRSSRSSAPTQSRVAVVRGADGDPSIVATTAAAEPTRVAAQRPAPMPVSGSSAVPASPPPPAPFDWRLPAMLVWAVGVAAGLAWLARGWARAAALRRRATNAGSACLSAEELAELSRAAGLPRPPRIAAADGLAGPVVLGARRPVVVLPADLLAAAARADADGSNLSDAHRLSLRLVLAHEFAHVRRRDLWWNWLAAATQIGFWFHPLVWLAGREWRFAQEAACDEAAVRATAAPASAYAAALVRAVAGRGSLAGRSAGGVWAVGASTSARLLKRRLVAMRFAFPTSSSSSSTSSSPFSSRGRRWLAAAAAVAVAAVGLPGWRAVAAGPVPVAGGSGGGGGTPPATRPIPDTRAADGDPGSSGFAPADDGKPLFPVQRQLRFVGTVAVRTVDMYPRSAEGPVRVANCREGAAVKAGEVLVQFDNATARLQVVASRVDLKQKELSLQRAQEVYADLIKAGRTNNELQQAEVAVEIGRVAVAFRQAEADQSTVLAPFDGVVTASNVTVGQLWGGSRPLATIAEVGAPFVECAVPPDAWGVARPGKRVEVHAATWDPRTGGGHELKFDGVVQFASPVADPKTGTVKVKVSLSGPTNGLLPGTTVEVRMTRPD